MINPNNSTDGQSKLELSNRYAVLSSTDSDTETEELMDTANTIIKKRARENSFEEKSKKRATSSPKPTTSKNVPKKTKLPQITVTSELAQSEIATLKNNTKGDLHIHYISINKRKIQTYSEEDFNTVLEYLKTRNHKFFSNTVKDMSSTKIVLSGLDPQVTPTDIEADLKKLQIEVVKVIQMKKTKNGITYNIPVYIIILKREENIQKVINTRYVCSYVAHWAKLKTTNYALQCYNCQSFGHSSRICNIPRRCVKCTESHLIGQCKVSKDNDTPNPTCCNCNGPHPANYRNCPALLNYLKKRENLNTKPKLIPAPAPIPLQKKFSEAVTSSPAEMAHKTENNDNDPEAFLKLIKELLTNFDLSKILNNIQVYLPKFLAAKGIAEIMMLAIEFYNASCK